MKARGRITEQLPEGSVKYNKEGQVDGVQLGFDPEESLIKLRLDQSDCPSFWCEVDLPLDSVLELFERFLVVIRVQGQDISCPVDRQSFELAQKLNTQYYSAELADCWKEQALLLVALLYRVNAALAAKLFPTFDADYREIIQRAATDRWTLVDGSAPFRGVKVVVINQ